MRVLFPDKVRTMGLNILGNRGTFKTHILSFVVAEDCRRGVSSIVVDLTGDLTNNSLQRLSQLPRHTQEQIGKRLVYVDMAGRAGDICPFPLYYRLGNESTYEISQRILDVIRKADAYLALAPIHGWNPTYLIGTHAGRVLFAAGCQISELENLLTSNIEQWEEKFKEIEQTYPEVKRSTDFFRKFYKWSADRRASRTEALLIKAATFTLDPTTLAMFNADKPQLSIETVIDQGLTVLIDFSGVTDIERRRFMLMWIISYIMAYLKVRGPGYSHKPLSLVIDEFSLLTNFQATAENSFEQELDELINVYSRSHRLWLTLSSQSLGQFSDGMQRSILTLGTQIVGGIADFETAKKLVQWFGTLDLWKVKDIRPVNLGRGATGQVDIFQQLIESEYLEIKRLQNLPKWTFLIRPALAEGMTAPQFTEISIAKSERERFVDIKRVTRIKEMLAKRFGIPIDTILSQIQARTPAVLPDKRPAILKPYEKRRRNLLPEADEDEGDIR
jgi:hypothetical protein